MTKYQSLTVKGVNVNITGFEQEDYISLTDIAKHRDKDRSDYILQNWMRNRNTLEFLGLWELLNNPVFKPIEFDGFKNQAGSNSFSMTPKRWIGNTNAIKENLIPPKVTKEQQTFIYASEADMLNVALFGITAKQWRKQNPNKKGNIRDLATLQQLVVLTNLESLNVVMIEQGNKQGLRLKQLNAIAISQLKTLINNKSLKRFGKQ